MNAWPTSDDPAAYVAESIASAVHRYEARVTVHLPAAELRRRVPKRAGTIEPIDDERCELRTSDYDLDWLALRIAMLDAELEVHEPPELVEHLKRLAQRVGRAVG